VSISGRVLAVSKTIETDMKEVVIEERERCAKAVCKSCREGYDRNATDLGTYHHLGAGLYVTCTADRIFFGTY
jgi:hypothetical protein